MSTKQYHCAIDSPLGRLCIQGDGESITGLYLPMHKGWKKPEGTWRYDDAPFVEVRKQLEEYFAGERQQFDVPLWLAGTPFQQRVWQELTRIEFGQTITYAQLAERVGRPMAARAVGAANGRNPISIIVPCHRVIGAQGKLTGYAGGIDKKQWLLDWERGALLPTQGTLWDLGRANAPIARAIANRQ